MAVINEFRAKCENFWRIRTVVERSSAKLRLNIQLVVLFPCIEVADYMHIVPLSRQGIDLAEQPLALTLAAKLVVDLLHRVQAQINFPPVSNAKLRTRVSAM